MRGCVLRDACAELRRCFPTVSVPDARCDRPLAEWIVRRCPRSRSTVAVMRALYSAHVLCDSVPPGT